MAGPPGGGCERRRHRRPQQRRQVLDLPGRSAGLPPALTTPRSTALLAWYDHHRRHLPWRGETDPYRVLVSEVMLQQTQALRVADRYPRFLAEFPTAEDLAVATPAAVLAAWQGLGYNRRALRLRDAARRIVADGWPADLEGLLALPGVGPYTAAAVACFAFGIPVPAPDTNARRVLSRWHGTPLSGSALHDAAQQDLPDACADWNQAVMDLGAALCTPRRPACDRCPVAVWCTDPSVYEPPRSQGRFEGSHREARGAVVRHLVSHPTGTVESVADAEGLDAAAVGSAADALLSEGSIVRTLDGALALPGADAPG